MGGLSLLTGDVPAGYAASQGAPAFAVWIGFAITLFAGLAEIVGFQTRTAAGLLILFTRGTRSSSNRSGQKGEWNTFGKEMSMNGGLLILMATGPGGLSVDERRK